MPVTKATMEKFEEVTREIESVDPKLDCQAHVRRDLLMILDRAHEMLACLIADEEQVAEAQQSSPA